jgi:hypothetical protein
MVRVTVPIAGSETAALESAKEFAGAASEVLPTFVPN